MEHVRLSPAHAAFVEEHVADGCYDSAEAYVAALIDAAHMYAQARLEALLHEGLESESLPWTPERMEEVRRRAGAES